MDNPAARFLRSAKLCRIRDLEQLSILGELVKSISELVHALQKERGASSIVLGSNGAQFTDRLVAQIAESRDWERVVRERLKHIDQKLDHLGSGARFYTRVALAIRALDMLPATREQVASLTLAPQDAVKAFSQLIGCLLAVGFEVADSAPDPGISRALLALVNFAQGKEYAGQERATVGAAFSSGRFQIADQRRLRHLVGAQEQAFRVSAECSEPTQVSSLTEVLTGRDSVEVKRMRKLALAREPLAELPGGSADAWFEHTTRRIDAMKRIEERMISDLAHLCAAKLKETRAMSDDSETERPDDAAATAPIAMLVTDVNRALNYPGMVGGIGVYSLDSALPKPMRSILDVIQAQSRRIDDVNQQLEAARIELAERKMIERAKGLLMSSRRLSEKESYTLMRQTAMNQNKRIIEIAEAIVSTAEILQK